MNPASDASTEFFRHLHEISARQKLSADLLRHLDLYFSEADTASFAGLDANDLHSAAVQHFRLGQARLAGQAAIAVYTPDFDRHGWHSPHTVIDIVTDDMSYLVDSIVMAIDRHGLAVHRLMHPVFSVRRSAGGLLGNSLPRGASGMPAESWIHLEVDRVGEAADAQALGEELASVLADVRAASEDAAAMQERAFAAITAPGAARTPERDEVAAFLRWLAADNFVFLGHAYYDTQAGEPKRAPDGGLGLLRRDDHPRFGHCLAHIPGRQAETAGLPAAMLLAKADARSTVHRSEHLDFVGVPVRDANGELIGEHVFVGLYAAHVYHISATEIPIVRRKVEEARLACGYAPGSYNDKTLINVLETYPRNELIEIEAADLQRIAHGIVMLLKHPRVRVFLRNDRWGRYVSALVYLPRDRFDTTTRRRITQLLGKTLNTDDIDFSLMLGEARLARLHLIARTPAGTNYDYDAETLEREVARIVRGWHEELQQHLIEYCGEQQGNRLLRRYAGLLPLAYQEQVPPTSAVTDLERLAAAEQSGQIEIKLNAPYGNDDSHHHVKLFHKGPPRPLSEILPIFENMGVTVLSEQPFKLAQSDLHVADLALRLPRANALADEATRAAFIELLQKLLRDEAENDGFNRLTLLAGLNAARLAILRAYARYLRQAGLPFSQHYVERCLAAHPEVARLLSDYFDARFSPTGDDAQATRIDEQLSAALAQLSHPDEDRILSGYRTVLAATMRTNAWQTNADGQAKAYLSFKISSKLVPFLPKPVPLYEIFVHSPRLEGIHLRGARVSRGGLRWSDRMEDYRTECLALVKAQMVKNAVTVPLGAKGCFVGKRLPPPGDREAWLAEGVAGYSTYIRGLLDLTDNIVDGKIVPPAQVRRHDGDDPYLVVAADKGTASFSDIANGIAAEYGFWLGDAFASGGSAGYDHKKMGITARGAWEAVKRHFRELGRDTQSEPFTAVGIGDMSGDVFGNGALQSDKMCLLAAFDHRHIFLDPDPDPATSHAERLRLFKQPRSSWDDYDRALLSAGGGVWPRDARSIPLSPRVRERLGIAAERLTPNELINALLKAPVDLLYNGGIGTYVKASTQSQLDANDRGNDAVRVDAAQIRAKVIGEGGNLGMTQKGRIEYARAGGLLYTDAIDNSAGVDCSDHEVNIKILSSRLLAKGDMSLKQRDALLASMTDDVARLVLMDNYQQTAAVSLEAARAGDELEAHARLIRFLEAQVGLDRAIEFLPDDKGLAERAQAGSGPTAGLTAPEIAVLLAYTKIALKESLLASPLPDASKFQDLLAAYFPPAIAGPCAAELAAHPLKREIITTQIVNRLVNRMGTSFTLRLAEETGAGLEAIVDAWHAASELLGAEALWHEIEALDLTLAAPRQMALMHGLRETVSALARRILLAQKPGAQDSAVIDDYRDAVAEALAEARAGKAGEAALSALLDKRQEIVGVLERVDLARASQRPLAEIAAACARHDAAFGFDWLSAAIARLPAENRWQAKARAQLAGELLKLRQERLRRDEASAPASPEQGKAALAIVDELIKHNAPQDLAMLSAGLAEIRRILIDE